MRLIDHLIGHHAHEGRVAKSIEKRAVKIPSDTFLWAAGGTILLSLILHGAGRRNESNIVGQWAPTLLILGLYNKIVKLFGSE